MHGPWGIRFDDGTWAPCLRDLWFTFDQVEAEERAEAIRATAVPIPDGIAAKVPRVAEAIIHMHLIQSTRILYQQMSGWRPEEAPGA